MTIQSEQQLENELIAQLKTLGYASITIKDESQLLSNLKTQIERTNGLAPLSETEWKQVISFLNTGTVDGNSSNDEANDNRNTNPTNSANDGKGVIQANVDLNVLTNGQIAFNDTNKAGLSSILLLR